MSKCKVCGSELKIDFSSFCIHQCEKKLSDIHLLKYSLVNLLYNNYQIEVFKIINLAKANPEVDLLLELVYDEYGTIISFKHYP